MKKAIRDIFQILIGLLLFVVALPAFLGGFLWELYVAAFEKGRTVLGHYEDWLRED
jgi:hypothetical protein